MWKKFLLRLLIIIVLLATYYKGYYDGCKDATIKTLQDVVQMVRR